MPKPGPISVLIEWRVLFMRTPGLCRTGPFETLRRRTLNHKGARMRIAFTFRNLEASQGLKNYANQKMSRLQKYSRSPLDVEVVLSTEKRLHCVDVTMSADGRRFAGHEESEDMYASIDMVMDKIQRQVCDAKAAHTQKVRHRSSHDTLPAVSKK